VLSPRKYENIVNTVTNFLAPEENLPWEETSGAPPYACDSKPPSQREKLSQVTIAARLRSRKNTLTN